MLCSSSSKKSVPSSWLSLVRRRLAAVMAAKSLPLMRSGSSLHRALYGTCCLDSWRYGTVMWSQSLQMNPGCN